MICNKSGATSVASPEYKESTATPAFEEPIKTPLHHDHGPGRPYTGDIARALCKTINFNCSNLPSSLQTVQRTD